MNAFLLLFLSQHRLTDLSPSIIVSSCLYNAIHDIYKRKKAVPPPTNPSNQTRYHQKKWALDNLKKMPKHEKVIYLFLKSSLVWLLSISRRFPSKRMRSATLKSLLLPVIHHLMKPVGLRGQQGKGLQSSRRGQRQSCTWVSLLRFLHSCSYHKYMIKWGANMHLLWKALL